MVIQFLWALCIKRQIVSFIIYFEWIESGTIHTIQVKCLTIGKV